MQITMISIIRYVFPLHGPFGRKSDCFRTQIVGIKSNFAQPFFIHWDVLLGTRMTRNTMEQRQRRSKEKVAKSS